MTGKFRSSRTQPLLNHLRQDSKNWSLNNLKLKDSEIGREILATDPKDQKELSLDLIGVLMRHEIELKEKRRSQTSITYDYAAARIRNALVELLRKRLPITEEELLQLLDWSMVYESNYWRAVPQIIKQLQDFKKTEGLTPTLNKALAIYIESLSSSQYNDAATRQQLTKLRELADQGSRNPLVPGEAWSDAAINQLNRLKEEKRTAWIELLNVCVAAKGSAPTAKWQKDSDAALKKIGWKNFKIAFSTWLPLVDKPRTARIERWREWSPDPNLLINDHNADILKGLVWMSAKKPDADLSRVLAALAISAYRKVPQVGPRCVRVGNACIWALSEAKDSASIGQLAILKARIKVGSVQKIIEAALEKAANRTNVSKDEIEETSVPDFGLFEVGRATKTFGYYTAEIFIRATDDVDVQWFDPTSKALKSTPASVKKEYASELKSLIQSTKDIRQMLSAQRDRIDSLYLEQKSWSYDAWRERYLEHPLVGTIARRLIWKFVKKNEPSVTAIWLDGQLVTSHGEAIDLSENDTNVELWHPLDETTENVLQWREFLETNLVRQPFKQAHREIYLLTDAERTTNVYSNRYAAHILKQHQFNALCAARRWKNKLRLMVDDEYPPAARILPKWDLRAEFWIEGLGDNYGEDTTDAGSFLYLSTDQVRFYSIDARNNAAHAGGGGYGIAYRGAGQVVDPVALENIPPLVFSEIMRDVDLFVGVASIGNDPNWLDTGPENTRRNYWYDFSFGELSASATTRKQILEKIIPKLKIASRCSFDDKFLIVDGDVRTYKIHLGSGNILMKPDDQYLCIVPSQGTVDSKVFLPFEGDQRVAVILSKAFLLSEDTKIEDKTILRQIRTR